MTGGFNLTERIQTVTKKLADVNAEMAWEAAGTAADVAGMIDPTPISDAVGAGIAIRNGDFLGAGLNVVGMIPYLGDAVAKPIKATRVAKRVLALKEKATLLTKELADLNALKKKEEAAELAAKEAKIAADAKKVKDAEKAAAEQEKAAAKAKDKDCEDCAKGGKPTKIMPKKRVTCFSSKKLDPSKSKEFAEQLKRQEEALNNLTVKQYNDARAFFKKNGRAGSGLAQKKAREKYKKALVSKLTDENRNLKKMSLDDAKAAAQTEAKNTMKSLAALHEPDMIAGGKDEAVRLGDKSVNSSIGSQWKSRVKELDEATSKIPAAEQANTKMNAKLPKCRK
nr:polymorphic toxin type 15 domain-containing protein [uncultured Duganella sp.]